MQKLTDKELMKLALRALPPALIDLRGALMARIAEIEQEEEWFSLPKETRDRMKLARKGRKPAMRADVTRKYEQAKRLVEGGHTRLEACAQVGLAYDSYMRRQRIDRYGRDRRTTDEA